MKPWKDWKGASVKGKCNICGKPADDVICKECLEKNKQGIRAAILNKEYIYKPLGRKEVKK